MVLISNFLQHCEESFWDELRAVRFPTGLTESSGWWKEKITQTSFSNNPPLCLARFCTLCFLEQWVIITKVLGDLNSCSTTRNIQSWMKSALWVVRNVFAHPPAAAACRQVLPKVSGVSIWKPADRTESLHIMLNLRPEEGSAGRRREARRDSSSNQRKRDRQTGEKHTETGRQV